MTKRTPLPNWMLDELGGIPGWFNRTSRPKACERCGAPIRIVKALGPEGPGIRIVEAAPTFGGWVRVYLTERVARFEPFAGKVSMGEGQPFIPFAGHKCPERVSIRRIP